MKHLMLVLYSLSLMSISQSILAQKSDGSYTIVVEGFDWGPAVNKVILHLDSAVSSVNYQDFQVTVSRNSDVAEITPNSAGGERTILHAYLSDDQGSPVKSSKYATLVLAIGPNHVLGSPFQYVDNENHRGNIWVDYQLTITHRPSQHRWTHEAERLIPLVEQFDLTGEFTYDGDITMAYASYTPKLAGQNKYPLIIWLHGGGEGGNDPTIPLLANRAANYATEQIQHFFGGAFVLVPQCPGAWMYNAEGVSTRGKEDDIYHDGLMALIKQYVRDHLEIDRQRIYLGGCSNGGYMSLKLIFQEPDYFAAGYISALAYRSQYITDAQIESIRQVPIWFIHSKDDDVTIPEKTVVPVYQRLKKAGAKNVHFTFYDHVTDITGIFGGEDYRYPGHWSWIYSHANHARKDFDGSAVMVDGRPVTIMEWMAGQKNE